MKQWVKDVVKDNRTFRLTFYKDAMSKGLYYCLCEEIYRKKKNIFDFTWKRQAFEFCTFKENIVEIALNEIDNIFYDEKTQLNIIQSLDNFTKNK